MSKKISAIVRRSQQTHLEKKFSANNLQDQLKYQPNHNPIPYRPLEQCILYLS